MSHAQFAGKPHGHGAHASNGHGSIWSHKTGMLAWRKGKEQKVKEGTVGRMLRGVAALMVLTVILAACHRTQGSRAQGPESAPDALVTFVELGSVSCIPCRMMQPIMRDIENTYQGQVKVVFHDVWTEEGKPYGKTYRVRVIPTQVFLDSKGIEYYRHEGFFPKDQLLTVLKTKGVK